MEHILIIGAGASGLMAGKLLGAKGHRVTILEARDRTGGRIHTQRSGAFAQYIEHGAEFIHGNLPVTLDLLKEAGCSYHRLDGEMWHYTGGRFHQDDDETEDWPLLLRKLNGLEEDCSINELLNREFGGEQYASMRRSVRRFVEGYDAADPDKVSALALREEWTGEDEEQYRLDGGYGKLVRFLEDACVRHGADLRLSAVVTRIDWQQDEVDVHTEDGAVYRADKVLITLPPALLQEDGLQFAPALPDYTEAARNIGCGYVIKFSLQFRDDFWKQTHIARLDRLQMLLSDEEIPTWWTQYPEVNSLLVGWIGGPKAYALKDLSDEALLDKALASLSHIFGAPALHLKEQLEDWHVANWPSERFSRCAYAYELAGKQSAKKVLNTPVAGKLFFAGEALYHGPAMGTVEAALASGKAAAESISPDKEQP